MRKKDKNGTYTDFGKCEDYRLINRKSNPDCYWLPLIETNFNDVRGAQSFRKSDLRLGFHQMVVLEARQYFALRNEFCENGAMSHLGLRTPFHTSKSREQSVMWVAVHVV